MLDTFESFEMRSRAIAFADLMLGVADTLPPKAQFSLREQLRQAALAIPTHLSDGCNSDSVQERCDLYRIAKGCVHEVVSLLVRIGKQGYLARETYRSHCEEADRITAMITLALERDEGPVNESLLERDETHPIAEER
jgi:four helix bundle protein